MINPSRVLNLCDSLELLIKEIKNHPDTAQSEYLKARLDIALKIDKDISAEFEKVSAWCQTIAKQLADLQDQQTKVAGAYFTRILERFDPLYKAGATPEFVCKVAKLEGIDKVDTITLIRSFWGLSLEDAQAIVENS